MAHRVRNTNTLEGERMLKVARRPFHRMRSFACFDLHPYWVAYQQAGLVRDEIVQHYGLERSVRLGRNVAGWINQYLRQQGLLRSAYLWAEFAEEHALKAPRTCGYEAVTYMGEWCTNIMSIHMGKTRAQSTILIHMRTGHNGLNSNLYSINKAETNMCPCGEGEHTVEHLLFDCVSLERQRRELLPADYGKCDDDLRRLKLRYLLTQCAGPVSAWALKHFELEQFSWTKEHLPIRTRTFPFSSGTRHRRVLVHCFIPQLFILLSLRDLSDRQGPQQSGSVGSIFIALENPGELVLRLIHPPLSAIPPSPPLEAGAEDEYADGIPGAEPSGACKEPLHSSQPQPSHTFSSRWRVGIHGALWVEVVLEVVKLLVPVTLVAEAAMRKSYSHLVYLVFVSLETSVSSSTDWPYLKMDCRFNLLQLPLELRQLIYRAYLLVDGGYICDAEALFTGKLRGEAKCRLTQADGKPIDMALVVTCRAVAKEMLHGGLALRVNTVAFSTFYSDEFRQRGERLQAFRSKDVDCNIFNMMRNVGSCLQGPVYDALKNAYPVFMPVVEHLRGGNPNTELVAPPDSNYGQAPSLYREFVRLALRLACRYYVEQFNEAMSQDFAIQESRGRRYVPDYHGLAACSIEPWIIPTDDDIAQIMSYNGWPIPSPDDEDFEIHLPRRTLCYGLNGDAACGVSRNVATWIMEALALEHHGMPHGAFSLLLGGGPAPLLCEEIFQTVVQRDVAWQLARDESRRRGYLPARTWIERNGEHPWRWSSCFRPAESDLGYMYEGFPRAMRDVAEKKSVVRCNFDVGVPWDVERIVEERRGRGEQEWNEDWFAHDPLSWETVPPLPSWADCLREDVLRPDENPPARRDSFDEWVARWDESSGSDDDWAFRSDGQPLDPSRLRKTGGFLEAQIWTTLRWEEFVSHLLPECFLPFQYKVVAVLNRFSYLEESFVSRGGTLVNLVNAGAVMVVSEALVGFNGLFSSVPRKSDDGGPSLLGDWQ
ncbi:hypothetical protein CGMCC3_g16531 [Colletotrichum fructicola]|nr:uncharacterized protein CGMCC3_g16531 [Colletotrichum fructicola]KAE9567354.1 hypothetical protein CGMCC3_g16531 [Colletotrichum fructicola]